MELLSIAEIFLPGTMLGIAIAKRPKTKKALKDAPKLTIEVQQPENSEKHAIVIVRNGYEHPWPEECLTFDPHIANSQYKQVERMTSTFKKNALTWDRCWVSWIDPEATDEEITELVADAKAKAEEWMNLTPAYEKARKLLSA